MTAKDTALDLFNNGGFNCAQSIFAAYAEKYGLDRTTALKITGAAGGGFRCAEMCGAAAGAMLIVGLKYAQTAPKDLATKNICNEKAVEFIGKFRERTKSVICRELLGCDTATPEGKKIFQEKKLHQSVCGGLICRAADLLEELGY